MVAIARVMADDIKIAHSVFAMPFALLGAFLARPTSSRWVSFVEQLGLVVVAMVLARTWAMLFNRFADRELDKDNPRTAGRALPSGQLSTTQMLGLMVASAAGFVLTAGGFGLLFENWWPMMLSLPVLGFVAGYSLTKRFTLMCHFFLGAALAISPLCAAVAINPASLGQVNALWWLAAMVLFWVSGFDVIYAFQDIACDRTQGLWSIPAKLGRQRAAWISRLLHGAASVCLLMIWHAEPRFGVVFLAGACMAVVLLIVEHVVFAREGLKGLNMAFFTLNGIISCLLGTAGVIDLVI